MKVLTVDVGTGTQDIYLYNSEVDMENGFKLVVPSPTMMVFRRLRDASRKGLPVVLTGVTMGGGPSHWAARDHAQAGHAVYATPDAARSFDDQLAEVEESGIQVISEEEARTLPGDVQRIELRDFDFQAITRALGEFGVDLQDLDAAAVAVFDHGAAPPGYSDRQFRFDYLAERLPAKGKLSDPEQSPLSALAFRRGEIPAEMTRLRAVERSADDIDAPLVVMDTAPAAVLGATLDERVRRLKRQLIANLGNFHTLAFLLNDGHVEGVFEHHTGLLTVEKVDQLLRSFAAGELSHEQVFGDHGHGALLHPGRPYPLGEGAFDVAVTGPRRMMMAESSLRPYYVAPFGDMMLVGCFGLLAAVADVLPALREPIRASLRGAGGAGTPPWEISQVS